MASSTAYASIPEDEVPIRKAGEPADYNYVIEDVDLTSATLVQQVRSERSRSDSSAAPLATATHTVTYDADAGETAVTAHFTGDDTRAFGAKPWTELTADGVTILEHPCPMQGDVNK